MGVLMKSIYLNWTRIISEIKKNSLYLLMVMGFFHICYFCAKGINTLMKYIADKLDVRIPYKIIKYPKSKKEEDILGI